MRTNNELTLKEKLAIIDRMFKADVRENALLIDEDAKSHTVYEEAKELLTQQAAIKENMFAFAS